MTREDAIEMLRNNVCNKHHVDDIMLPTIVAALQTLIPELRESENERIIEDAAKDGEHARKAPKCGLFSTIRDECDIFSAGCEKCPYNENMNESDYGV